MRISDWSSDVCSSDLLEKLPDLLREIVDRHDKCLFVRSSFLNFNASSLDFELLFDVLSENYDEVTALRSLVGFDIIRMFAKNGFEFANPTQTTFTAAPDGTMVLPYPESGLVMQLDKNEDATQPQSRREVGSAMQSGKRLA